MNPVVFFYNFFSNMYKLKNLYQHLSHRNTQSSESVVFKKYKQSAHHAQNTRREEEQNYGKL